MQHLDEGTIHSWLDGALSADEAARTETHVASCPVCAEAVAEARGLIAASSRILLALDNVPSIKGVKGAGGSRFSLATWRVRERIAAVVAVIVAGGALAVAMSRDAPPASRVDLASEPVAFEVMAMDSPAPPPVAAPVPPKDGQTLGGIGGGGAAGSQSRVRDLAASRQADSAPASMIRSMAEAVTTHAAAAPPARTDDTARSVAMALPQAQREEGRALSAEAQSSAGEKLADAFERRRAAADAPARYAEPRVARPGIGGVAGGAARIGDARLVQEERMTEGGREVRRRIYSVDGILVTLDERPGLVLEERQPRAEANAAAAPLPAQAAPAPAARDSAAVSTNTIRWTDARGAELTLTGPASPARLEQIRKLLGY